MSSISKAERSTANKNGALSGRLADKLSKRGGSKYGKTKTRSLLVLCAPATLLLFVFSYLPMLGLVLAFKDYRYDKGILGSDWVGLDNFKFFFTSQDAMRVTANTVGHNLVFIATVIIGSCLVALLLNEIRSKIAIKAYQTIYFLPYFLSWTVIAYIVYAFLEYDYGILNKIMAFLGKDLHLWYNEAKYWRIFLPVFNFWKDFGYNTVVLYAALMSIDTTYYEAAEIDGANRFQMAYYITIPHITSIITVLTILMLGKIFHSDFGLFHVVTRDSGVLYSTVDVIDTYIYRALRVSGDVGLSTAIGLYQSVVGLILVLTANFCVAKFNEENALF